jgi:hypothetical protein
MEGKKEEKVEKSYGKIFQVYGYIDDTMVTFCYCTSKENCLKAIRLLEAEGWDNLGWLPSNLRIDEIDIMNYHYKLNEIKE